MTAPLMLTLIIWLRQYLSGVLSLPFHCVLSGKNLIQPTLKELRSTSLRVECLYKLFGILPHRGFVASLSFNYLCNHLFISVWTQGYLFILWVITQYCSIYYFVAQIVLALVIGNSCVPFAYPRHFWGGNSLNLWNYNLLLDHLVYILPQLYHQPFLQGALVLFIREQCQRPTSKCQLYYCYWGVIASIPSQLTEQGNICVYTNLCVCMCVYIYIYIYTYTHIYKYFYMQSYVSILS